MATVVIVEDDHLASMALKLLLEGEGYETRTFSNVDEAYERCLNNVPDILIADWCVPGEMTCSDLAVKLREIRPAMKVVFVSGYDSEDLRSMILTLKDFECLPKPIQFDKFLSDIGGGPQNPVI